MVRMYHDVSDYVGPLLMDIEVASGCFAINGRALRIPPHTVVYTCQYFLRIDSMWWDLLGQRAYALCVWADIANLPFRQVRPPSRLPSSGPGACKLWFVQAAQCVIGLCLCSVALSFRQVCRVKCFLGLLALGFVAATTRLLKGGMSHGGP